MRDSTGWYFSRPERAHIVRHTRRGMVCGRGEYYTRIYAYMWELGRGGGADGDAPSTRAASRYGGQTTSPLPFIVFQHLRPVTMVWMVSLMPEEGETE